MPTAFNICGRALTISLRYDLVVVSRSMLRRLPAFVRMPSAPFVFQPAESSRLLALATSRLYLIIPAHSGRLELAAFSQEAQLLGGMTVLMNFNAPAKTELLMASRSIA